MKKIALINDTIDKQDIDELIEWLKTFPRLTKGELTVQLESEWAKYIGTKYSVFVNSGSSANLLLLYALSLLSKNSAYAKFYDGNARVVVPAISWATDLSPVIQLGFKPVLVDCNMEDLTLDLDQLEVILENDNHIVAVISVSVLGFSPNMDKLVNISKQYHVDLIEDNCESMGTKYHGKHLGNFGIASTYSTYFGHHISTIEGGFVNTNDEDLYHMLLMLRSHGWDRDLPEEKRNLLRKHWNVNNFDALLTFYHPGFNLRSTDLNAKLGLLQLKKLNKNVEIRNKNFNTYQNLIWKENVPNLPGWKPKPLNDTFVSNFAYPVIHPMKYAITYDLIDAGVETRPLICGSMGTQPMYIQKYGNKLLYNANKADQFGFYVPNHPEMNDEDVEYICNILNRYKGVSV